MTTTARKPVLAITLPLPARVLSPNARPHWAQKAKAAKAHRRAAFIEACAMQGVYRPLNWPQARMVLTAYWPTARYWDDDNLVGACKAYRDGFADAGVVVNDRDIRQGDVNHHKAERRDAARLVVTLTREAIKGAEQ